MARKTATQITEKYQRKMAGAGKDYEDGVKNPSRSWEEGAKMGEARWGNSLTLAISEGRYGKGVSGKNDKWQRRAISTGVSHYATAAQDAAKEYGLVADKIISITAQVADQVHAMGNATPEQREQRALANMRGIREAWRQGR